MGRKKMKPEFVLAHEIKARVNNTHFEKLQQLLTSSRHHTMSELVREIICERPIVVLTRDQSLTDVMEELSRIRKEFNAIGVNINQVTRQFHKADSPGKRNPFLLEIMALHKELNDDLGKIYPVMDKLSRLWLQK